MRLTAEPLPFLPGAQKGAHPLEVNIMQKRNILWNDKKQLSSIFANVKAIASRLAIQGILEVDDIVQNAMLRIVTAKELGRKSRWLQHVVRNSANESLRYYLREKRNFKLRSYGDELDTVIDQSQHTSWLTAKEREQFGEDDLKQVMDKLSPAAREVLILLADDQTYQEIADATKVKLGTVRSRVFYARVQARGLLRNN
jgi:RNA polymerase sigma factor (sigma-70 family)